MPFAVAAGISAGAGLIGGVMQSNAVNSAADKANAAQMRALEQSRADLEPWRTAGQDAIPAVQDAAGLHGQEGYDRTLAAFHTSPGYQWQLDQGLRAVDAGAAAQGFGRSGAVLKAEQTFGTGLADKEFTDYYNRLFNLSKMGQDAASGQATASQNTGRDIASTDLSEGSALSSIYGNAAQGIGNAANSYANNSLYQSRTNALMNYGNPGARAGGLTSSSSVYQPQVNMNLPAGFV